MSYSYVSSSDLDPDFDLNLDILNVRVDSNTKNVQISVTDSSYDFYFSIKLYNIKDKSFSSLCNSESSVSTKPISLSGTTIDELGKFVEVHLINITIPRTYLIHVACIDSTPLYYITIAKVG
jgi:hypothetical protein